uniref:Uncharacterized protein n=1 Tax=Ciona savignyi TaxID=51511 RepID=H2ZPG0_CIOSA
LLFSTISKGYPVDSSLPGTGVQRGSTISDFGDPSTPGYPSTDYAYRVPVQDIDQFPPLPLQPIAYDDAEALLRDMGGDVAPSDWVTGLDVDQIRVGPGFYGSNATREVHLVTNNRYEVLDSYNVIGGHVLSREFVLMLKLL